MKKNPEEGPPGSVEGKTDDANELAEMNKTQATLSTIDQKAKQTVIPRSHINFHTNDSFEKCSTMSPLNTQET